MFRKISCSNSIVLVCVVLTAILALNGSKSIFGGTSLDEVKEGMISLSEIFGSVCCWVLSRVDSSN